MAITFEVLEQTEIDGRIDRLLKSVQLSLDEIRTRGTHYALSPREQGVLDQIEDLMYLRDAA
ncbi:protein of unknown function [Microbacterium sp. Nx66]|uniref:hypothetical protein n=1 Tax=Microbacterium sp. Nx66 TaxID=2766784 RepID=UPI001656AC1B|nr:hypothetical protein [Microbacterium sp. Nx66]CAD5141189.1 protein of unknown function [Microbacterium sp. Nx66]